MPTNPAKGAAKRTTRTRKALPAVSKEKPEAGSKQLSRIPYKKTEGNYQPASPEAVRLGTALYNARVQAGIKQKDAAAELGRSQASLSTWELGVYVPLPADLFRLEQIYRVPAGSLSQHIGYVPITPEGRQAPRTVSSVILKDPDLDQHQKEELLGIYRGMIEASRRG